MHVCLLSFNYLSLQRYAETLDAEVKRWSSGKEGNLRALLSTLQYVRIVIYFLPNSLSSFTDGFVALDCSQCSNQL